MGDVIFETVHGSHLYGLAHEGSDLDLYKIREGSGKSLRQKVRNGIDVVQGDLPGFLDRALSGSHQSVEALFSPVKTWGPGMEERWGPMLEGLRISGPEVFSKYERTIKAFSYGDFKRRRHAIRLSLNLRDLRDHGRFNPRLTPVQVEWVNGYAAAWTDDRLYAFLKEGLPEWLRIA